MGTNAFWVTVEYIWVCLKNLKLKETESFTFPFPNFLKLHFHLCQRSSENFVLFGRTVVSPLRDILIFLSQKIKKS